MIGMRTKRRCGDCVNINFAAYGADTPVCYQVCQNHDRPVATAVIRNDKRAEYCGHFKGRDGK